VGGGVRGRTNLVIEYRLNIEKAKGEF